MNNNIVRMPSVEKKDKFIKQVVDGMNNTDAKVMIAIKMPNGEVHTAYHNIHFNEKQELIGHLQLDLVDAMIMANIGERY